MFTVFTVMTLAAAVDGPVRLDTGMATGVPGSDLWGPGLQKASREPSIAQHNPARTRPDLAAIHEQLRSSKYVTLQLLWEEYRQGNPEGYRYSRFCELYQRWRSKLDDGSAAGA